MVRAKRGAAAKSSSSKKITSKLLVKPKSIKPLAAQAPPKFDTLPVKREQCSKAIRALVSHAKSKAAEREESDLLAGGDDAAGEPVWLGVALKQM